MIRAVIICHGNLATELLATARCVLGELKDVFSFSNENLSIESLYTHIAESVPLNEAAEYLFMVDVRGGNCWRVAKMLNRQYSKSRVISGVNLPMLISYLTKRNQVGLNELAEVVENDARKGIILE